MSHHSLVTPIDWKLRVNFYKRNAVESGHHSLVTPIDWKPHERKTEQIHQDKETTLW